MSAYCCGALTFWLLTHFKLSASSPSWLQLKAPLPLDSAHLFFLTPFLPWTSLCPAAERHFPRRIPPDKERLLNSFFSLHFSPSVCISPPPPHFSLPRLWTQCSCVHLGRVGGGTSHNHQSEGYWGQLSWKPRARLLTPLLLLPRSYHIIIISFLRQKEKKVGMGGGGQTIIVLLCCWSSWR